MKKINLLLIGLLFLGISSCSSDDDNSLPDERGEGLELNLRQGVYILNEGGFGKNEASVDCYDEESGQYHSDAFAKINPTIVNKLGDTGNDIQVYGSKAYVVVTGSNYVEVMDARTGKHLGKVDVISCRSIAFDKGYAYVSSNGEAIPGNSQPGKVVKIDTINYKIAGEVAVGPQPVKMAVTNDKLYVANSGGYITGVYNNTVSVINLISFSKIKDIIVGYNSSNIKKDQNNKIWVVSAGDYNEKKPEVYVIDSNTDVVVNTLDISISGFDIFENTLYYFGNKEYGTINTDTYEEKKVKFFDKNINIRTPYQLAINPYNGDFLVSDAVDYVSSGKVYCFSRSGNLKWGKTAGIIPGHFAFFRK